MVCAIQAKRKYTISDSKMLNIAETFYNNIQRDLTEFEIFDREINTDWLNAMRRLINTSQQFVPNSSVVSENSQLTKDLKEVINECIIHFRTHSYFIEKVFSNNSAIMKSFANRNIRNIRGSGTGMLIFYQNFLDKEIQYKEELLNAGITEEGINKSAELKNRLEYLTNEIKKRKKDKEILTGERIHHFNGLWECIHRIHIISKFIYRNNRAKWNIYKLPS